MLQLSHLEVAPTVHREPGLPFWHVHATHWSTAVLPDEEYFPVGHFVHVAPV